MRIVVALMIVCSVRIAGADDAAKAAEHVAAAKQAFAEAHYSDAIAEFRAANALQPDPKLVYSIAQAQRMAGDCAAAIASYDEFIQQSSDAKLVEFSKANIARCKEQLAKEPPKPAVVEPAKPEPPPVQPPAHVDTPRDTTPSWTRDWLGHGLVGGGAVVVVVGTIVWSSGRSAAQATNDATDHDTFLANRDAASSAVTKQRAGIALGLAGIGLAVGGVVHYKLGVKREAHVAVVPGPDGGAVVAGGRF